jgi:hypothetical protein
LATATAAMEEIVTERSGSILRIQLNRPARKNAITASMYVRLADLLNDAARDEGTRIVVWHGAGDSFSAGNDVKDFLKNPPGAGESPQAQLMNALIDFEQETPEAPLSRAHPSGHEGRERSVQRASSIGRREGSAQGISRKAPS